MRGEEGDSIADEVHENMAVQPLYKKRGASKMHGEGQIQIQEKKSLQ